jgi:hypothetical protein
MANQRLTRKKINFGYMRFAKILAFLLVTLVVWGCYKNKMSPIPEIVYISQSSVEVADSGRGEFEDITFLFDFQDGDADIGPIGDPVPLQNITFVDSRDSTQDFYDFPPIPEPVVTDDGIRGSFVVRVNPNTFIARDDTTIHKLTDTVQFEVFVRDEAGNLSNEVTTRPIVIVK